MIMFAGIGSPEDEGRPNLLISACVWKMEKGVIRNRVGEAPVLRRVDAIAALAQR